MCQSAVVGSGPVLTGLRHLLRQYVGRGFGGFLDLCEKIFFLKGKPGGHHNPPQVEFFYVNKTSDAVVNMQNAHSVAAVTENQKE